MTRSTRVRLVAAGGLLALGVTACGGSSGGGTPSAQGSKSSATDAGAISFSIDNKATGPAPAIEGAKTGGTIKVLDLDDITHLDPAQIYVNTYQGVSQMITRQLNTYREGKDGKVALVGDLATDSGTTSDGGKTWTWHLRDGIKWADGAPITAAQIKYGIERAFAPQYDQGPTYLLEWLADNTDFRSVYKGPYSGKHLDAVQAPDDKTVVLKFAKPHADVPFAAALTTTAPVRPEKDTKEKYDTLPDASGPYKIESHVIDKSLVLVKNTNWDPKTDPARYQLVDKYVWEFGSEPLAINKRLIAANGEDAQALTLVSNVSPEVLQQVDTTPALKSRTLQGFTQFVLQYNINNKRVTDKDIRKAIALAFPKQQVRQIVGGASAGDFATTVLSPTVPGFEKSDTIGAPPTGDAEGAKKILADKGKSNMPLVIAFGNTARGQQISVALKTAYDKAGFKTVLKPIESKTYYDEIGKVNNQFDLYSGGWGADWPSGATVIPPTLDGRKIADGAPNYSHYNNPEVNAEIDRISAETDLVQAGKDWAALDKKIMADVPYVPYLYDKAYQLYGPKLKGMYLDPVLGEPSLNGIWVE
jgi:peptide/nickel transport system substrate-binding protein